MVDLFVKQNEKKDNEHMWKAHTNVGESDVQEYEQIVTNSFLSTPTSPEERTRPQQ